MSFAQETGYIPSTIADLMNLVRAGVNQVFGTAYDEDTFLGTNFYKFFYAMVQRLQENEVRASEIVLKLQQYFEETNQKITRPNTTNPGLIDYFAAAGFVASVKAPIDADAGKLFVCLDLVNSDPDYAAKKLQACTIIKDSTVGGVISQGTEVETLALSNDQSFDFKYGLPTKTAIKLKLTLSTSANNQFTVLSPDEIKAKLFSNINARYRLGLNFEPQRYFSVLDAPWAASVLLEYSTNGGSSWASAVAALSYNALYTFGLADITLVET